MMENAEEHTWWGIIIHVKERWFFDSDIIHRENSKGDVKQSTWREKLACKQPSSKLNHIAYGKLNRQILWAYESEPTLITSKRTSWAQSIPLDRIRSIIRSLNPKPEKHYVEDNTVYGIFEFSFLKSELARIVFISNFTVTLQEIIPKNNQWGCVCVVRWPVVQLYSIINFGCRGLRILTNWLALANHI